jgi:hypothetical protein
MYLAKIIPALMLLCISLATRPQAQAIAGRIFEPAFGVGVDSVKVSAPGLAAPVYSDSQGRFSFSPTSMASGFPGFAVPYFDAREQALFWTPAARAVRIRAWDAGGRLIRVAFPPPTTGRFSLDKAALSDGFYALELLAGRARLRVDIWMLRGRALRAHVRAAEAGMPKGRPKTAAALVVHLEKKGWAAKDVAMAPGAAETAIPLARDKIKILIVDGFNNHNWAQTTTVLKAILGKSGFFAIDVATSPDQPPASAAYQAFQPRFRDYEAVILNVCNINTATQWPDRIKRDFANYIDSGGAAYAFHAAAASFSEWPEYVRIVGMTWADAPYGPSFEIVNGIPKEIAAGTGSGTGHGERFDALVHAESGHAITRGMPSAFLTLNTEVYVYPRTLPGVQANTQVLGYAQDKTAGTGKTWPLVTLVRYGKGFCVTNLMGHLWDGEVYPDRVADVGMHALTIRAVEWLARREIMYPVPKEFPTATKTVKDSTLKLPP